MAVEWKKMKKEWKKSIVGKDFYVAGPSQILS